VSAALTQPEPAANAASETPTLYGLAAEFSTPAAIMHAAETVTASGFRWFDCHVPFPVHGLDKAMGVKPTILPILVFFGGLTGLILACILQIFTNSLEIDLWALVPVIGYQFQVSGKPLISGPAFVPVAFELTVLFASLTTAFGMLVLNGLPRLYHPVLKSPRMARATDDKFYLVIEARDPQFFKAEIRDFLQRLDPDDVFEVED
jgi:hypothetical protein